MFRRERIPAARALFLYLSFAPSLIPFSLFLLHILKAPLVPRRKTRQDGLSYRTPGVVREIRAAFLYDVVAILTRM